MSSAFQRATSTVLAVLILGGGMTPPGVCHTHADGHRPHRHKHMHHDAVGAHGHHHGRCAPNGIPAQSHEPESRLLTDAVAHVHVDFIGIDVTWPVSDSQQRKGQPGDPSESASLVFRPCAWLNSGPAFVPLRDVVLRPLDLPAAASFAADQHDYLADFVEPVSLPLCDSARRKRTGVFLI